MQYVVTSCPNRHEENPIARMLHLVQNSMNCYNFECIYFRSYTYDIGYVPYTAPKVAVYSLVKQPVVVQTHWFNKVCCCTVINSVKP